MSGTKSQSSLNKIAALPRCGGLLSRLAYERGRKEGIDVVALLRHAQLTPHEIKNKDIRLGEVCQAADVIRRCSRSSRGDHRDYQPGYHPNGNIRFDCAWRIISVIDPETPQRACTHGELRCRTPGHARMVLHSYARFKFIQP